MYMQKKKKKILSQTLAFFLQSCSASLSVSLYREPDALQLSSTSSNSLKKGYGIIPDAINMLQSDTQT